MNVPENNARKHHNETLNYQSITNDNESQSLILITRSETFLRTKRCKQLEKRDKGSDQCAYQFVTYCDLSTIKHINIYHFSLDYHQQLLYYRSVCMVLLRNVILIIVIVVENWHSKNSATHRNIKHYEYSEMGKKINIVQRNFILSLRSQ